MINASIMGGDRFPEVKYAPILLFTYKRLDVLKKTVDALKDNIYADESVLYIFSDGARTDADLTQVNSVRDYLKEVDGFKKVVIIERNKNCGLARNIVNGVTTIVNKSGKVIVLEDDLVTSRFFLKYMNEALLKFENNPEVMEVSGFSYPIDYKDDYDAGLVQFADCWGWGTWKRSWKYFERRPRKLIREFSLSDIYKFNLDNGFDQWEQVILNYRKKLNTWAVFWAASIYKKKGLMLYPYQSLVKNIGLSGDGEHGATDNDYNAALADKPIAELPNIIKENSDLRKALSTCMRRIEKCSFKKSFRKMVRNIVVKFYVLVGN